MIALVNTASPTQRSTIYTYDPSGTPTMSGTSNNYPFLYHGMEHEFIDPNQFYYSGDGAFYSAQIMRSLSETDAQGTSGPGPGAGKGHHHHGGRGGGGGHGAAINGHVNAGTIAQDSVGGGGESGGQNGDIPVNGQDLFQAWVDFWDSIANFLTGGAFGGGGGPSYPPNYFLFQHRLTFHKHQAQAVIMGIRVLVDQGPPAPASRVIAQVTGDGRILLYRAVKEPELSQLAETGTFRSLPVSR